MSVRKVAIGRSARAGSQEDRPKRNRLRLFLLLTLGAGGGAWIAALIANSWLGYLATLVIDVHSSMGPQVIEARTMFAPVPPVHKTVTVYDPPAATGPSRPTQKPAGTPPTPGSNPSPLGSPRPTPTPDD